MGLDDGVSIDAAKNVPDSYNQKLNHLKCPSKVCNSVELMEASDLPRNC